MEDKRKQHSHGDSCQVERAKINDCADLLLATACDHTWKIEKHKIITTLIP
jgi:hypothetical protein